MIVKKYHKREPHQPLTKKPNLRRHILHDAEIKLTRGSRLRLRLIVTKKESASFKAACNAFGMKPSRDTAGIVKHPTHCMVTLRDNVPIKTTYRIDNRYFAIMILRKGRLGIEEITHECVHAAIFYAYRNTNNSFGKRLPKVKSPISFDIPFGFGANQYDRDQGGESVCYPAGIIAEKVYRSMMRAGLFG